MSIPPRTGGTPAAPQFTGYIIARLNDPVARRLASVTPADFGSVAVEIASLRGLLERYPGLTVAPLVTSLSFSQLHELEDKARHSEFPPLHSLTAYLRLDARSVMNTPSLLGDLIGHWSIELAYLEQHLTLPAVTPDPLTINQRYLEIAPLGIDAYYAWTIGVDGSGVGFMDLERSWNELHQDLQGAPVPTLVFHDNYNDLYEKYHGTAVLGVVAAKDNGLGVLGVAPAVASVRMVSLYDQPSGRLDEFTDAVGAAIGVMAPGDVLLLETQLGTTLPCELDPDKFDAIRLAVGNGIVVVECGGNGGHLLDDWVCGGTNGYCLNRNLPAEFLDSGAIMVASCDKAVVGGGHMRHWSSNHGSRMDCYAWGEGVWSAGDPGAPLAISGYDGTFSGTSSAGAIIAGAALLLQSRFVALTGGPLSPSQIRALLANKLTGTLPAPGTEEIGVMPNLRAVLANAQVSPDIYLRDALGDDGSLPSAGASGISPDIIVVTPAVPNPTASFGQGSGTENSVLPAQVLGGVDHFIYVRMRNRGAGPGQTATAKVFWSESSTLLTPADWHLIGTTPAIAVPQGGTLQVAGPLTWASANIPGPGHYCFLAILDDPADPAPITPGPLDWSGFLAFITSTNNVAWRNFDILQPAQEDEWWTGPFSIRGAPDEPRSFSLEFRQSAPALFRLEWEIPSELLHRLPLHLRYLARPSTEEARWSIPLPPLARFRIDCMLFGRNDRYQCRLRLTGEDRAGHRWNRVGIRQLYHDQVVGGMTWELPEVRSKG